MMTRRRSSNLLAWSLQVLSSVLVGRRAAVAVARLHAPAVRHAYWRALLLVLPAAAGLAAVAAVAVDRRPDAALPQM